MKTQKSFAIATSNQISTTDTTDGQGGQTASGHSAICTRLGAPTAASGRIKAGLWALFLGLFCLLSGPASAQGRRLGPGDEGALAAKAPPGAGIVNINEAGADQLVLLPGVGPSRARAIIEHRKSHPFKRVEDLTRIKGIGKKTFAKLRPLLALSGPTTLQQRPGRGADGGLARGAGRGADGVAHGAGRGADGGLARGADGGPGRVADGGAAHGAARGAARAEK